MSRQSFALPMREDTSVRTSRDSCPEAYDAPRSFGRPPVMDRDHDKYLDSEPKMEEGRGMILGAEGREEVRSQYANIEERERRETTRGQVAVGVVVEASSATAMQVGV